MRRTRDGCYLHPLEPSPLINLLHIKESFFVIPEQQDSVFGACQSYYLGF